MTEYTLSQWVLFFYIYCFLGWVWECLYVSICKRKFVNRGFMKGPFLPIYGSGAICILIVTIPFRGNIPLMCIAGMVSAAILEYVTGYVMEQLFRVRYWDYTGKFLNLNGYICLASVLCWGVMTILVVDVIHVYVERLVLAININIVDIIVMVLTPLLTADFVTSFTAALRLRDILIQKELITEELKKLAVKKEELESRLQNTRDHAQEQVRQELRELYTNIGTMKGKLHIKYPNAIRGLLKRNPHAVSRKHKEMFAEVKKLLFRS